MNVVFFHRKPRPNYNFSVENLFHQIRLALPKDVNASVKQLSFFSSGFFQRLFICIEAMMNQGDVNHVTGDINFVTIFLRKRKTVLTILDVGFMNHPNYFARWLLKWFWIILPVRRAGIVITISEATKREVLKFAYVNPDKIKVIYVPILSGFTKSDKPFNKTKPVILQLGTKPNKNVARLARALRGIPCRLDIVGEVSQELESVLKENSIEFTSSKNLSNEEVLGRYQSSDIISFVSTYEGFGMPIVEGNAVGRVVITSNILSMPEVAANAAHLVDPFSIESIREGIKKLIDDDKYREELIRNGHLNCRRFDVNEIASQYRNVYAAMAK